MLPEVLDDGSFQKKAEFCRGNITGGVGATCKASSFGVQGASELTLEQLRRECTENTSTHKRGISHPEKNTHVLVLDISAVSAGSVIIMQLALQVMPGRARVHRGLWDREDNDGIPQCHTRTAQL